MNAEPIYTPGHSPSVTSFMRRRTAEKNAAFLLPYLRPDQRLLDVGCGPGTITVGLAARLTGGSVVGIDMNRTQVEAAAEFARTSGISNVTFSARQIGVLGFTDREFQVVFAHAILEHISEPVAALREFLATLEPGGIVAVRSPEWGGLVLEPDSSAVQHALAAYEQLQRGNGGNLRAGRQLARWVQEAGFELVQRSATYEIYDEAETIASYLASQLEAAGQAAPGAELRAWAQAPGAMFAQAWFEAIGRRPAES